MTAGASSWRNGTNTVSGAGRRRYPSPGCRPAASVVYWQREGQMDELQFVDGMERWLVAGIILGCLPGGWDWSRFTAIAKRFARMEGKPASVAKALEMMREP